jgi:hypothetical protein
MIVLCSRYVHRSRRFDTDYFSVPVYETYQRTSSGSVNHNEFSTTKLSLSSTSTSTTIVNTYAIHLRRHNHSYTQKRKVTIVLICCLCVPLLLWTPQSLSLTYETLIESYVDMSKQRQTILLIFNNFANLFLCINASIDFILYCFLSDNFVRTCKQIICRQCVNYTSKFDQRSRFLSFDRGSLIFVNASNTLQSQHQQQPPLLVIETSTPNSLHVQRHIHDTRGSISKSISQNKKWKKVSNQKLTRTKNDHDNSQSTMGTNNHCNILPIDSFDYRIYSMKFFSYRNLHGSCQQMRSMKVIASSIIWFCSQQIAHFQLLLFLSLSFVRMIDQIFLFLFLFLFVIIVSNMFERQLF